MSVTTTRGSDFKAAYKALAPSIAQSLPSHIPAERFERATMVAVQRNVDLLTKADRKSLFLALQRAAQDGLMPDGREGAIVLFGNQAQWMPMVAGLMKLARNSGEIASISAHVVYKGEKFTVVLGDEERIEHERSLELADNTEIIAAYSVATLKNGEKVREVMTRSMIDKVRRVSKAGGSTSGPWHNWFDQMAIKSVIRRMSKRLPLSTDRDGDERFQRATEREDDANTIDGIVETVPEQGTSKLDALESSIGDNGDEGEINASAMIMSVESCETIEQLNSLETSKAFVDAMKALSADDAKEVAISIKARRHGITGAAA